MQILTVDIGTGTQDIFLFDSRLDIENGFKLVLPSPTMMIHRRLKQATRQGLPVALSGVTMGGGPSGWAVEAHLQAGLPLYSTPDAARTLNDDLQAVQAMGVQVIGEDEVRHLPEEVQRLELRDFDFPAIRSVFERFGVPLAELDAVAVAVFDHGAAPPEISDRQFRFDYLDARIRAENRLSAFAYPAQAIPASMTRLQAVAASGKDVDAPLVVMDTAPAAVLGATFDPLVGRRPHQLIANVGNFHTLAFRLGPAGIEGVFEHHTGFLDLPRLESYLVRLAEGSLTRADVFDDQGHGALVYSAESLFLNDPNGGVVVTGPRRNMLRGSQLHPYFATPFGDMMIAGCFGLLAGTADCLPGLAGPIYASLHGRGGSGTPPWEAIDS
jgi:uncharacterized protein (DUF1786 family)